MRRHYRLMSKCQKNIFRLEQLRFFPSLLLETASTRMFLLETTSRHGSHSALFGNDRTRMVFFLFDCLTNYYDAFLLFWIRFYFPLSIYIDFITFWLSGILLFLTSPFDNELFSSRFPKKSPWICVYDMCASSFRCLSQINRKWIMERTLTWIMLWNLRNLMIYK